MNSNQVSKSLPSTARQLSLCFATYDNIECTIILTKASFQGVNIFTHILGLAHKITETAVLVSLNINHIKFIRYIKTSIFLTLRSFKHIIFNAFCLKLLNDSGLAIGKNNFQCILGVQSINIFFNTGLNFH